MEFFNFEVNSLLDEKDVINEKKCKIYKILLNYI